MKCFCTKTKTYHCKVVLLDDQELLQEILNTSTGQDVLDTVFRHLNLIETSYFGLRYVDCTNQTHWLDTTKKIAKQLKGKASFTLYFGVKFYAADPCKLVEEITRYQFFLQIKQDILHGRLPVPSDILAELGAYAVQSELGDYDVRRHAPGYVSEFRFVSSQTVELENKVAGLHKDLQGQLPAVAELNFLDKVKWLEMYGVDLHPVIGEDNVEYFLGLTPSGVIVLRNKSKVANYFWSRIKKIYFKGKYFMLRVSDKNNEENTYGFETPSRAACKHLYKCCKEHQSFFQLLHVSTNAPDVINTRFSSSNKLDKLSGRSSQLGMRNPPAFVRTPSRRYQKRIVEGASDESKLDEKPQIAENNATDESKNIYVIPSPNSLYPTRSDSPRSTRSAPWGVWNTSGPPRTSHSSHSPRSVRSAGPQLRLSHARRSSSVESQSSIDSRPCRRHKHRSKRGSDNESEISRCSSHGHGSHRRHRHRSRRSSGSEQESHTHHSSRTRYQLIDSEGQWKEVQRRKAEGSSIHEATVIRPGSGYVNSGIETESEHSTCHHHRRKHRKHRSRSRSPSDGGKTYLPDELKQHLEFQLVDTEGMSEDQLREIPYTVVKTNAAKAVRVRLSSTGKPKVHSIRKTKSEGIKSSQSGYSEDSPPPPYSESPVLSDLSNKTTTSTNTTAGTATSDSNKHVSRLPSHLIKNNNSSPRSSCSALYGASSHSQSNLNSKDIEEKTAWLSENAKFSNLGFVVGLPPQPHGRRFYNSNSHSDLSLNASRSQNQKGWPSPEIRGTVGISWSSVSDQMQSPSLNSLYAPQDSNRRAPILNSADYNINQNILEHRSNSNVTANSNFRNSPKPGLQSVTISTNQFQNRNSALEIEKLRKQNTLAESGVLRSHSITPNGKMAWPNDRQLGWHPKCEKSANVNQSWNTNGTDWSSNDYNQWNTTGLPTPPNITQNWQQPTSINYRNPDRTGMYSSQPQMQRIKEEATSETQNDYVNLMNNNSFVGSPAISPNNNQLNNEISGEMNGKCEIPETSSSEVEITEKNLNFVTSKKNSKSPTEDTKNNNDFKPVTQLFMKQFFQEMSTEL